MRGGFARGDSKERLAQPGGVRSWRRPRKLLGQTCPTVKKLSYGHWYCGIERVMAWSMVTSWIYIRAVCQKADSSRQGGACGEAMIMAVERGLHWVGEEGCTMGSWRSLRPHDAGR